MSVLPAAGPSVAPRTLAEPGARQSSGRVVAGFARAARRAAEVAAAADATTATDDERFAGLFTRATDAMFVMELNGAGEFAFADANPAFLSAQAVALVDIVGRRPSAVLEAERAAELDAALIRCRTVGLPESYDEVLGQGGAMRVWHTALVPLPGLDGAVLRIAAISRDMTERRRAEIEREQARARQQVESLGALAGGVAHDFNNLLTTILGNAEMAAIGVDAAAPAHRFIRSIEAAGERAAELTRLLLAYAGKSPLQMREIDLSEVAVDLLNVVRVSLPKHIEIHLEVGHRLPRMQGDSASMRQVLLSLIKNSEEAIGNRAGEIEIRLRRFVNTGAEAPGLPVGTCLEMQAIDNGCGMDAETRSRMFEPFFTTKFAGRGLGLAATVGIVRSHGGSIQAESTQGQGTTVTVFLPAVERPVAAPGGDYDPHWQSSATVLVVDDEAEVREVAQLILESHGISVICARDGVEGLRIYRSEPDRFGAIILDATMPRMGGAAMLDEVRAISGDLPVLLISGWSEEEVAARFAGKGLNGFLAKPFGANALGAAVRPFLTLT